MAEGVQLEGERNHVLRNQIIGTTERGVDVRGLEEPTGAHVIADNLIADGADGIALLDNSQGNHIRRNTIYGNSDQGIFVGTFGNTIERNQVLLNRVDLQDNTPSATRTCGGTTRSRPRSRTTASTDRPGRDQDRRK